jgi:hypothetical protein
MRRGACGLALRGRGRVLMLLGLAALLALAAVGRLEDLPQRAHLFLVRDGHLVTVPCRVQKKLSPAPCLHHAQYRARTHRFMGKEAKKSSHLPSPIGVQWKPAASDGMMAAADTHEKALDLTSSLMLAL